MSRQGLLCTVGEVQLRLQHFAAKGRVSTLKGVRLSTSRSAPEPAAQPAVNRQQPEGAASPEPLIGTGTAQQRHGQLRAPSGPICPSAADAAPAAPGGCSALSPEGRVSPAPEPALGRVEDGAVSLDLFMTGEAASPLETPAFCPGPPEPPLKSASMAASPSSAVDRQSPSAPPESGQRSGKPTRAAETQGVFCYSAKSLDPAPQGPPRLPSSAEPGAAAAAPLLQTQFGLHAPGALPAPECSGAQPPPAHLSEPAQETQPPPAATCSETQSLGQGSGPLDREDASQAVPSHQPAPAPRAEAAATAAHAPTCATQYGGAGPEGMSPDGGWGASGDGPRLGLCRDEQVAAAAAGAVAQEATLLEVAAAATAAADGQAGPAKLPEAEVHEAPAPAPAGGAALPCERSEPGKRGPGDGVQPEEVPQASALDPEPSQVEAGSWWVGGWRVSAHGAGSVRAAGQGAATQGGLQEGALPAFAPSAGATPPGFAPGSSSQALRQVRVCGRRHD